MLRDGETKEDLLKLTKEELLLRWMNYHLDRSDYKGKEIKNFSSDIKDSIPYTYLLTELNHPIGLGFFNLGFRTPSSIFFFKFKFLFTLFKRIYI